MPTNSIFDSFQAPSADFFKSLNLPKPPLTHDLLAEIFTKNLGEGKSSGDIAQEIFGHLPESKQTPQAYGELENFAAVVVDKIAGEEPKTVEGTELTDAERTQIIDQAEGWVGTKWVKGGDSKEGIDCSHLVHRAYQEAGFDYGYTMTTSDWEKSGFKETTDPKSGDLILWSPPAGETMGHVGIVLDPAEKTFIGSQRSTGVAEANYDENKYWGKRSHKFLTYQGAQN